MGLFRLFCVAACFGSTPGASATEQDASLACERAAVVAEQAYGLPTGLLTAIGRVETGRRDAAGGRLHPWPWSIDADGSGAVFPDAGSAQAAVLRIQARGQASIDVGCFQINLLAHPQAFTTLGDAFDPALNADYAGRFLTALRQRLGGWPAAIMAYHSSTPGRGDPYLTRVLANWTRADEALGMQLVPVMASSVRIWNPAAIGQAPAQLSFGVASVPGPTVVYLKR